MPLVPDKGAPNRHVDINITIGIGITERHAVSFSDVA